MWKGLTIHCEFIIMVRLTGCGEVWYRAWFGSKRPRVRIPTLRPEIWNPHLRVPDFLLMAGFEGPHQSADWRKQVSGKHLLSEKVSAVWLLTKQRSLFFCCAQVSVLFLILQYKKLVTSAHGVSRAHSDSLQADGLPVLPR